jgi:Protein CHAPERONE-LIKE PROTEIN OF POR1-like
MSDQNPYEKLGVSEGASFEAIQAARDRRLQEHDGNASQVAAVQAAYDQILMERLRLRQEGKIKVPDRIRFPEKLAQPAPGTISPSSETNPGWLGKLRDRPTLMDVALPTAIMAVLAAGIILIPSPAVLQLAMALGTGSALYLVFRKERKFGRAVLLSLGGLVLGFSVGYGAYALLASNKVLGLESMNVVISLVTFFILWAVSSFFK